MLVRGCCARIRVAYCCIFKVISRRVRWVAPLIGWTDVRLCARGDGQTSYREQPIRALRCVCAKWCKILIGEPAIQANHTASGA